MCFLIFTFLFISLVILGFTLKKAVVKIQCAENVFSATHYHDCSKQVSNYKGVIASKQTEKKHHGMADLSPLLKQNHSASFRDSPLYLSARLCVFVCMHAWDHGSGLRKNMHVFNKENVHLSFGL